jgi:hypothetical protein
MSEEQPVVKKKSHSMFYLTAFTFLVLGGLVAGGAVYCLARVSPDVLGLKTTIIISEAEEAKALLSDVAKIMDIPQDETPSITTVTDTEKSATETYFKNAKNGDKVIYFKENGKIILYRPTENKIIDVGFITTPTPTPTAPLAILPRSMRFFIFNGTSTLGATKGIEAKLKELYPNAEILGRTAANKTNYIDTVFIDLIGSRAEDAKKMADELGISVGVLPGDEKGPDNSDFLIIVGKNSVIPEATSSATPTH